MRTRRDDTASTPRRILAGLWVGACLAVAIYLMGGSVLPALVFGGLGGLLFGAAIAPLLARAASQERAAARLAPGVPASTIRRSALRGPVPHDPQVREAAAQLASKYVAQARQARRWVVPPLVAAAALQVWSAATEASGTLWVAVGLDALAIVLLLVLPGHYGRRLAALEGRSPDPGG